MAFGSAAVTSPTTSKITWTSASARSSSSRRNSAARSVGAAVLASCKQKPCHLAASCLGMSRQSKVSPFERRSSDASTAMIMNDDCGSSTRCSSASSSNMSLPGSPNQEANQEAQPQTSIVKWTTRRRSSSVERSPDLFSLIAFELGQKACFKTLNVSEAFKAADQDHDGILTEADMKDVFWFFGMSSSDASIFFELMDKEGESRICWREIIAILELSFKCYEDGSM